MKSSQCNNNTKKNPLIKTTHNRNVSLYTDIFKDENLFQFWRKFSQLKIIYFISLSAARFGPILLYIVRLKAYHIHITQFVFIFAVAHILFFPSTYEAKLYTIFPFCVFSLFYTKSKLAHSLCAFPNKLQPFYIPTQHLYRCTAYYVRTYVYVYQQQRYKKKNITQYCSLVALYRMYLCSCTFYMSSISSHSHLSIFVAGLESVQCMRGVLNN